MNNLQKGTEFYPTASQSKYLQVFLNQTNETTKQELCEQTGISTKTLWEWEKNPHFNKWISGEIDKITHKYTNVIKVKILEKARQEKATVQERELALRIVNEYTPTTKTINENTDYEAIIQKILAEGKEIVNEEVSA